MTDPAPGPDLVPGELRGYRRFRLAPDGLHPCVHDRGPWSAGLERAVCVVRRSHQPPARGCGCGLYAWYSPDDADAWSGYGTVTAVVAAQGRVVLGDTGYRAAAARVEAVALPRVGAPRWAPEALARAHPGARVYRGQRAMLRDHPPHDLSALGVEVVASPAARARRAAVAVWLVGAVLLYAVMVLPPGPFLEAPAPVWVSAVGLLLVWQVLLVRLFGRASGAWRSRPLEEQAGAQP